MSEPKYTTKNRPLSIKGFTFEEAVSELLKHKPLKDKIHKKRKNTIMVESNKKTEDS